MRYRSGLVEAWLGLGVDVELCLDSLDLAQFCLEDRIMSFQDILQGLLGMHVEDVFPLQLQLSQPVSSQQARSISSNDNEGTKINGVPTIGLPAVMTRFTLITCMYYCMCV